MPPDVLAQIAPTAEGFIGYGNRRLLSVLTRKKLERVLGYLLDEPPGVAERRDRDHAERVAVVCPADQSPADGQGVRAARRVDHREQHVHLRRLC